MTAASPAASPPATGKALGYLDQGPKEGARLVSGGKRAGGDLSAGFYVEPTVFGDVSNTMTMAREEIFGPVASVIAFDTVDEVLALANDTEYGLGSGVWSTNMNTVWVNCHGMLDPAVGFGGWKHSGYGCKGGQYPIDGHLAQKAAYINVT